MWATVVRDGFLLSTGYDIFIMNIDLDLAVPFLKMISHNDALQKHHMCVL